MHVALDAFCPPWPLLALPRFLCRRWFIWWMILLIQVSTNTTVIVQCADFFDVWPTITFIRTRRTYRFVVSRTIRLYVHSPPGTLVHFIVLYSSSIELSFDIRPYIFHSLHELPHTRSPRFILYQVLLVSVPVPFVFFPAVSPDSCIGSTCDTQLKDRRTTNAP